MFLSLVLVLFHPCVDWHQKSGYGNGSRMEWSTIGPGFVSFLLGGLEKGFLFVESHRRDKPHGFVQVLSKAAWNAISF